MNPHNLNKHALLLLLAVSYGCAGATDDARDESFMSLVSVDAKADDVRVVEGSAEARAIIDVANLATLRELRHDAKLSERASASIIARRDGDPTTTADDRVYTSLRDLDDTPWVGIDAFIQLRAHAARAGYVARAEHPTACTTSAQCGGTAVCHVDRCFDVRTLEVEVGAADTLTVDREGQWWVTGESGSRTRQARGDVEVDQVESSPDLDALVVVRTYDGSLTAVTQAGDAIESDLTPTLALQHPGTLFDAITDAEGRLLLAVAGHNAEGVAETLLVFRYWAEGWRLELKWPMLAPTANSNARRAFFTNAGGGVQLWTDQGSALQRHDRRGDTWHEAMHLDLAAAGFGDHADRTLEVLQAGDVMYVWRTMWDFARTQQLVRIEGSMVTAVIDLPSSVAAVAPHPDRTVTLTHLDGHLSKIVHSAEQQGDARVGQASATVLAQAFGDNLLLFDGAALTILTAR